MNRRAAAVACLALAGFVEAACARDRATELPDQPGPPPRTAPAPTFPPMMPVGPRPVARVPVEHPSASAPSALVPPPPPPPPAASTSHAPPAAALAGDPSADPELFRAQDACLSSCDQFACMKIASAYREGAGLPRDVLAGRRYAIHACLECGKPGPGIAEQCPEYQLSTEPKAK